MTNRTPSIRTEDQPPYNVDIGPAKAIQSLRDSEVLRAASTILLRDLGRGDAMSSPAAAGTFIHAQLFGRESEAFMALYLDTRHRVIAHGILFTGTIDGSEVHPREVVKAALAHNAAAIIIGHNHPSGVPDPSAADRAVTARLKQALALVDVRLLDHFVVADGSAPVSMAARGWI